MTNNIDYAKLKLLCVCDSLIYAWCILIIFMQFKYFLLLSGCWKRLSICCRPHSSTNLVSESSYPHINAWDPHTTRREALSPPPPHTQIKKYIAAEARQWPAAGTRSWPQSPVFHFSVTSLFGLCWTATHLFLMRESPTWSVHGLSGARVVETALQLKGSL